MSLVVNFESIKTFSTGFIVFLNHSSHISSNFERVNVSEKSIPSTKSSTSTLVVIAVESIRLEFSISLLRRVYERLYFFSVRSISYFYLIILVKYLSTSLSRSSPPKWVSPEVAITLNTLVSSSSSSSSPF